MTHVRGGWHGFLVVVAALATLGTTIQHAKAGPLVIDIPNCTPTATASGNSVTITCGTTTTPGAPSGCVATANTTSLTSSGGSVTLSATCGGGTPTSWTWTKNSASFGANSSAQSDTLPANGTSSPASYTYTVTASNSSGSAAPASVTVTVAAGGSVTPPAPPPTGAISCSGYTKTIVLDIPWQNSTSSHSATTNNQGFGPNDAVVVRFTVPAGTAPTGSGMSGNIGMAEWGGGQFQRFAKLSQTPCDFAVGSWLSDTFTGISISFPIYVTTQAPAYAGATLQPGATYYLNVRNKDQYGNSTCRSETGGSCDMFVDMFLPKSY